MCVCIYACAHAMFTCTCVHVCVSVVCVHVCMYICAFLCSCTHACIVHESMYLYKPEVIVVCFLQQLLLEAKLFTEPVIHSYGLAAISAVQLSSNPGIHSFSEHASWDLNFILHLCSHSSPIGLSPSFLHTFQLWKFYKLSHRRKLDEQRIPFEI